MELLINSNSNSNSAKNVNSNSDFNTIDQLWIILIGILCMRIELFNKNTTLEEVGKMLIYISF